MKFKINELLEKQNKNMSWLSKVTGITLPNISKMCKGDNAAIRIESIDKICTALQCNISDILEDEIDDGTRVRKIYDEDIIDNHPYNIITLCGSTKFKDEFDKVCKRLTLEGNIVLSLGVFSQYDGEDVSNKLDTLKKIHLAKIAMSDSVFIVNPGGYIGSGTKDEIAFAKKLNKKITYLYNI